jgi:hypothetical protein
MEMIIQRHGDLIRFAIKETDKLEIEFKDFSKTPSQHVCVISPEKLFDFLKSIALPA